MFSIPQFLTFKTLKLQLEELTETNEQLNSENIKLMSALQNVEAKVSKIEKCVCDLKDGATQTSSKTTVAASTLTDNISSQVSLARSHFAGVCFVRGNATELYKLRFSEFC